MEIEEHTLISSEHKLLRCVYPLTLQPVAFTTARDTFTSAEPTASAASSGNSWSFSACCISRAINSDFELLAKGGGGYMFWDYETVSRCYGADIHECEDGIGLQNLRGNNHEICGDRARQSSTFLDGILPAMILQKMQSGSEATLVDILRQRNARDECRRSRGSRENRIILQIK